MLCSGALLNDRYRLEDRVATGGMGEVWRATDRTLQRPVAVKVLLPALLSDPEFSARFQAEARMLAALHHPGVVRVYDYGENVSDSGERAMYLVMQYVEGEPLSQRIKSEGQLSVGDTMKMVDRTARALHAAHQRGIIHRDVKPDNLLVQADGSVVLVDFGVARSTATTRLTAANTVLGTALYMAPEQASGGVITPATDIYALGAVAYHCLAGQPPFTGDKILEVAIRHLQDEPPPLPADIPPAVAALVMRTLAKSPADRYPDAAAFARAARATLSDPATIRAASLRSAGMPTDRSGPVRAGDGESGRGPSTVRDMIAVPVAAEEKRRSAGRTATVGGAAVAVLLALVGMTAALGFTRQDDKPSTEVTNPPPSVGASTAPPPSDGAAQPVGSGGGSGQTSGPGQAPASGQQSGPSAVPTGTATGTTTPTATATTTTTPTPTETAGPDPTATETATTPVDPPTTTETTTPAGAGDVPDGGSTTQVVAPPASGG